MSRATYRAYRRHVSEYSADDLKVLHAWYFEREAGYPNLKKFEGGANWPTMEYCPACEGGDGFHVPDTWNH